MQLGKHIILRGESLYICLPEAIAAPMKKFVKTYRSDSIYTITEMCTK